MEFNSLHKLRDNIEAIRIALANQPGTTLSADDIAALRKYAGFGGVKAVMFPAGKKKEWEKRNATKADLQLYPSMMELHQLLKEHLDEAGYLEAVQSIRDNILTAYYTPDIVPQNLYTVLKEQGISPKRLYEPSSGAGIFVDEALKAFPGLQQVNASTIHYTASSGVPNTDNPKTAARYFINAIDKVDNLLEKYTKDLGEQQAQIPQLKALLEKPFEKEKELIAMKSELNVLEKEIARKTREKQEAQQQSEGAVASLSAAQSEKEPEQKSLGEAIVYRLPVSRLTGKARIKPQLWKKGTTTSPGKTKATEGRKA